MAAGERMPDCFFYQSDDGDDRLMIQRGEHAFCPYGANNPDKLIKRWFENLNLGGESLFAITGFGDGSHLRYFLRESGNGINFLVSEKDPALIRETLARFDLSDLLAHQREGERLLVAVAPRERKAERAAAQLVPPVAHPCERRRRTGARGSVRHQGVRVERRGQQHADGGLRRPFGAPPCLTHA